MTTYECNLTKADYKAFRRYVFFKYRKFHWLYALLVAGLMLLNWFEAEPGDSTYQKICTLVAMLVILGGWMAVFFLILAIFRKFTGGRHRGPLGPHVFEISEGAFTETNPDGRVETRVQAIRRIGETRDHFFIINSSGVGHVVPKRCLPDLDAMRELQSKVGRK